MEEWWVSVAVAMDTIVLVLFGGDLEGQGRRYKMRQTNRQIDKQTDRQTDRQTNRQIDKQTDRQTDR